MSAELERALARHPAGQARTNRPGYGLRMKPLREAQRLPVLDASGAPTGGHVEIPAVHVLECVTCEALFRVGGTGGARHYTRHKASAARRAAVRSIRAAAHAVTHPSRKAA